MHDTTELSFPGESPRQGLVFNGKRNVLQLHASILVGIDKAPVVYGLAGLRAYVVENHLWGEVQAGGELQALTSGSDRWRDAAVAARRDAPIGTRIVHAVESRG